MICKKCGAEIQDSVKFCTNCGEPCTEPEQQFEPVPVDAGISEAEASPLTTEAAAEPQEAPAQEIVLAQEQPLAPTANPTLIGWSDRVNSPEITKKASARYKRSQLWATLLAALLVIAACGVGFLFEGIPLTYALLVGALLAAVVLIINSSRTGIYTKPVWEGEVIDKKVIEKRRKSPERDEGERYYLYKTIFRTTDNRKKDYVSEDMYTYLRVGDKVRFHPTLQYFEKYDKSRDLNIYCSLCRTANPIENDICNKCKAPLIKPEK